MPRHRPVREVMTSDVVTLHPEQSLEEALRLLAGRGISGAPVADEDGRLSGLLDDSDLLLSEARLHGPTTIELLGAYIPLPGEYHRYTDTLRRALGQTVGEVMDPEPPSVTMTATVEDVATLMVDWRISRVPVVDEDNRVVGIVTRGDLVAAMYPPEG